MEIQTGHLANSTLEHYRHTRQLCSWCINPLVPELYTECGLPKTGI